MAEDLSADVRKYVSDPNTNVIVVRYCGTALQKRDSSLVSFNDREEMKRVRST